MPSQIFITALIVLLSSVLSMLLLRIRADSDEETATVGNYNHQVTFFLILISNAVVAAFLQLLYNQRLIDIVLTMVFLSILWSCSWYDRKMHLIPNKILLLGVLLRLLIMVYELMNDFNEGKYIIISAVVSALAMMLAAGLCRLISPGSVGLGDLKLLGVAGLFMGIDKIGLVMMPTLLILFFYSLYMLLVKKADRKTEVAFAPFLLAGTLIGAILTGA